MTRLVCLGVASLYLSALCEEVWGVKGQASPWKGNLFMHLRKKCYFSRLVSSGGLKQVKSDSKYG